MPISDLTQLLDRLAVIGPSEPPFLSLYVDARPDDTGREHWHAVVRKELGERARTYGQRTAARDRFDASADRALAWLTRTHRPSADAAVVFAGAAAGVFEAVDLDVPLEATEVVVAARPHLYPLARLLDRHRRYAVVVSDSHLARVFVIALGAIEPRGEVMSEKLARTDGGGWSQARYQRHVDQHRVEHTKDVVEALARVVREERVHHVALAGDEVTLTRLRAALPKALASLVTELPGLGVESPATEILRETLELTPREDARDDAERVARMYDAYRAGGLAMIGLAGVMAALDNAQVHELLLTASPDRLEGPDGAATADGLVRKARQTDARVRFIEDTALLAEAGGVGAFLRYRLHRRAA
jgi:peptide chain release factor subunit 1